MSVVFVAEGKAKVSHGDRGESTELRVLLRQYRKQARLTQNELADLSAVSSRTIRNLEGGGDLNPRPDTVRRLADALRLTSASRASLELAVGHNPTKAALAAARDRMPEWIGEEEPASVSREREINSILDILRSRSSRIVTISGFGGVGKSWLAASVARSAHTADAMSWLWLCPTEDGELSGPSSGDRLVDDVFAGWARDFVAGRGSAVDELAHLIARRPFLLVLDDVDTTTHDVETALGGLLRRCPRMTILETTRKPPPRRRSRHVVPLMPLRLPDPVDAHVDDQSAIRFLIDHIRTAMPDFEETEENRWFLVEACRSLDGIPRALKSAAPWFAFYTPEEIAAKAASDPCALAAPPGEDAGKCWIVEALTDARECTSRWQEDLLVHLTRRSEPWTLDQIVEESHRASGDVIHSLHSFLKLGLIRPANPENNGSKSFTVLNLIRRLPE